MKHKTKQSGFTLIELLVVMSIIALLLSVLMPALGRAKAEAMLTKEEHQIKAINSGLAIYAPHHNGLYPIPGLKQREQFNGSYVNGKGPEDMLLNDHASFLSMCIMEKLFPIGTLIGPTESSDTVFAMENYNFDAYDGRPTVWQFWDPEFRNDLESESNNSYGFNPITGKRKHVSWRVSDSSYAMLGNRGPRDSEEDPYSQTNLLHGIDRGWSGVISFGDGHQEYLEGFSNDTSTFTDYEGDIHLDTYFKEEYQDAALDPIYGNETGNGTDSILTHVKAGDVNDNGKGGGCEEFLHN
ncbi:MAG: type II secretion system protein [Phycisphaerales bacterium]|jgi:prepilin-type N-terminal cleavage/methylation domain-containing protein|nr:type II secretion system protein [Phycisphaerales bacterium]